METQTTTQLSFGLHDVRQSAERTPNRKGILPEMRIDTTIGEFFAGIGLMRLGLERAGWRVVWANDIDRGKKEMYDTHFGEKRSHLILGDVHNLPASDVPNFGLATASFPCTDLSVAGARRGFEGAHSSAFWGFVRILRDLGDRKPALILIENVTGFVTANGGSDFRSAISALSAMNYSIDAFVVNASHFVPQSRERLFVLCQLGGKASVPPVLRASRLRPQRLMQFIYENPSLNWQINELPEPPVRSTTLADIIEDLPSDSRAWWSQERAEYLLGQMSPRHRMVANSMIESNKLSYGTVFRRTRNHTSTAELRSDGIAGCLRTPKGGSAKQILFRAGFGGYTFRLLSARECARLMGAEDYIMDAPLDQALFGFGDAVCVPVIEWIARNYLNHLVGGLN